MKRRAARSGFALLLTLLLVVIAGIALAGIARRSMLGAVEARDATEELQRRWAIVTCQETLMPRLPAFLEPPDDAGNPQRRPLPPAEKRFSINLAGHDYQIVLTDEQAKLNVAHWLQKSNAADAEAMLKRLLPAPASAEGSGFRIHLRPTILRGGLGEAALPKIGSYEQLLENTPPHALLGEQGGTGLASFVTCWGDGRVNLSRAPVPVIRQVCAELLTGDQIDALLSLRSLDPQRKLADMLEKQALFTDQQRSALQALFTYESKCFGFWIIAQEPQRSHYALMIAEMDRTLDSANQPRYRVSRRHDFAW